MPKIAISIGDPNGIGPTLAIRSHQEVSKICSPVYFCHRHLLEKAAEKLGTDLSIESKNCLNLECEIPEIMPGVNDKTAGAYAFESFRLAVEETYERKFAGTVTLPISKKSWELAGLSYVGHTDYLAKRFKTDAIMMIGVPELFCILYTDHIPLSEVSAKIRTQLLVPFLKKIVTLLPGNTIHILGLNPHAGEGGLFGSADEVIGESIRIVNEQTGTDSLIGPISPDTAFRYRNAGKLGYFVAMYHDQGLIPVKALYTDESINVSLNLPVKRSSVAHGTAFDIAYKATLPKPESYLQAIRYHLT